MDQTINASILQHTKPKRCIWVMWVILDHSGLGLLGNLGNGSNLEPLSLVIGQSGLSFSSNLDSQFLAVGSWMWVLAMGSWFLAKGSWLWDPCCGLLSVGPWLWDPGSGTLLIEHGRFGCGVSPPVLHQIRQNPVNASTVWRINQSLIIAFLILGWLRNSLRMHWGHNPNPERSK